MRNLFPVLLDPLIFIPFLFMYNYLFVWLSEKLQYNFT